MAKSKRDMSSAMASDPYAAAARATDMNADMSNRWVRIYPTAENQSGEDESCDSPVFSDGGRRC